SSPARALNSDDLPLPVAPASAATVCSTDRLRRVPARSATAWAYPTASAGSRPSASEAASSRAVSRESRVGRSLRRTSFTARPLARPRRNPPHAVPRKEGEAPRGGRPRRTRLGEVGPVRPYGVAREEAPYCQGREALRWSRPEGAR